MEGRLRPSHLIQQFYQHTNEARVLTALQWRKLRHKVGVSPPSPSPSLPLTPAALPSPPFPSLPAFPLSSLTLPPLP